jgi:hypothetical protein
METPISFFIFIAIPLLIVDSFETLLDKGYAKKELTSEIETYLKHKNS